MSVPSIEFPTIPENPARQAKGLVEICILKEENENSA